jgi:hypothetical protein
LVVKERAGTPQHPSISSAALRFCDDKRAARRRRRAQSLGKAAEDFLRAHDFCFGARCAFVTPNAQRATYVRSLSRALAPLRR